MPRRGRAFQWAAPALVLLALATGAAIAGPGDGIHYRDWSYSPYIEPTITYDSNPLPRERERMEDVSASLRYGLSLSRAGKALAVDGSAWGASERYVDLGGLDNDEAGQSLRVTLSAAGGTRLYIDESFRHVQEVEFTTADVEEYSALDVRLGIERALTPKIGGALEYQFSATEFAGSDRFDRYENQLQLTTDYRITGQRSLYLTGHAAAQSSDGNDDDSVRFNLVGGIRYTLTDKVNVSAGVGIVGLTADDASVERPTAEANLSWAAKHNLRFTLGSTTTIQPASDARNTYHTIVTINGGFGWTVFSAVRVNVRTSYRRLEEEAGRSDGRSNSPQRIDDALTHSLRLSYALPSDFMSIFVATRLSQRDSTLDALSSDRATVTTGLSVRY